MKALKRWVQDVRITIKYFKPPEGILKHLLQGLGVAFVCALALIAIFPQWYGHPTDHLIGPDRFLPNTDLSNSLLMIQRGLFGESGCETRLFSLPLGATVCSDVPNPLYTSVVAWWAGWFGLAWTFNWSSLSMLALNGACLFWVARLLGVKPLAAVWGALFISICPTIVSEVAFGRPVSAVWGPAILGVGLLVFSLRKNLGKNLGKNQEKLPGLAGAILLGIACLFSPVTVLLLAPWVAIEALSFFFGAIDKRKAFAHCAVLLFMVAAFVVPIALSQAGASPTRLLSEGWWGSHLDFGQACISGAEIPSLYPWNQGRISPLVGAGGFVPVVLLFSAACFSPGRRLWAPIAGAAALLVVLGSGPCLGGSTPISWAPIRLLSESVAVFKLVPIWRFWAAASILTTLAAVLVLNGLTKNAPKKDQLLLHGLFFLTLLFSMRWHVKNSETTTVSWPTHPTLEHLLEESVLLDLPLVNDRVVIQTHVAELPVPRFNPERHQLAAWRKAAENQDLALLLAADALQNRKPWRPILKAAPTPWAEESLGLRRILLYTQAAEPRRIQEWRDFLGVLGTEFEMKNDEIEVYRLVMRSVF